MTQEAFVSMFMFIHRFAVIQILYFRNLWILNYHNSAKSFSLVYKCMFVLDYFSLYFFTYLMSVYSIKRYDTAESFLEATRSFLEKEELPNAFVLTMTEGQRQEEFTTQSRICPFYFGAVWNAKQELVFTLCLLTKTLLYGSKLLGNRFEPVDLLIQDLVSLDLHKQVTIVHSFQPVLSHIHNQLEVRGRLKITLNEQVWAYSLTKVNWPLNALKITESNRCRLELATEQDVPLLAQWIQGFWDDIPDNVDVTAYLSPADVCRGPLKDKFIYILYFDDEPVSMAWKRRPLKKGVSIAYVFTPNEKRGLGFAAACVALLTEELLKSFQYVTLFALKSQNPERNLYTSIGFELCGESGRLRVVV
jgi:hypothetical protein